jgi:NDP-4-keto-2,6-dideoxyhexose 3-C-methyltransferase
MYQDIHRCRGCGNTNLVSVLDLGVQALTGVFPRRRDEPVHSGPLELLKCVANSTEDTCGLVQLRQRYDPSLLYGYNYGYRSGLNRSMVEHLQKKAARIKTRFGLHPADIALDIGSNDGTLLRALQEPGVTLVGMDPTAAKFSSYYPTESCLIPELFSAARFQKQFGSKKAKVITSIAMFYDLDDPLAFMGEIADLLAPDGVWVFEQSYLPSMLETGSYDTVCHEHQEYYALGQIVWLTQRAGLKILDVELSDINGGSFSVAAALAESPYPADEQTVGNLLLEEQRRRIDGMEIYSAFSARAYRHRDQLRDLLRRSRASGERILGYGASTKGNVILQLCGITPTELPYIAEVNSDKCGCFTPGTLIPIISEQEAHAMRPDAFLVLPWHFRKNLVERESAFLKSGGKLVFPLPEIEVVTSAKGTAGGM